MVQQESTQDADKSATQAILFNLRKECLLFQNEYDPKSNGVAQITEFLENHIFPARDKFITTLGPDWSNKLIANIKDLRYTKYVIGPANRYEDLELALETRVPALALLNFLTFNWDSTIINFQLYLKQGIRTDSMVMKVLPSILERCNKLTEVYLTSECNNRIVKQIANANHETLQVLSIRKAIYVNSRCLPEVLRCVNLCSLELNDTLVTLEGHQLRALPKLRHLYGGRYDLARKYDTFDGHTLAIEEATLEIPHTLAVQTTCRVCPKLQRLNLINVDTVEENVDWQRIETLTRVTIEETKLQPNDFIKRFFTIQTDTITALVLNKNQNLNRRFLVEMSEALPYLEYFKFTNCHLDLSEFGIGNNKKYFERLLYLISDSKLPFSFAILLLLHCIDIRVIDLNGYTLDDHTLNIIMQTPNHFRKLETFKVSTEHMSPELRQRFKAMCPKLQQSNFDRSDQLRYGTYGVRNMKMLLQPDDLSDLLNIKNPIQMNVV